jgi:hypothetical protein
MDSAALGAITDRGLGELCGVRVARRLDNGAMERFTDDKLNGKHVGERRDARIEFWGDARGLADVLEPVASGVRFLTEIEDYFQRPCGPGLSVYRNPLGGRVVVMGYAPWMFLQSVAKREQLLNLADWVAAQRLPVRLLEPAPVVPFLRWSATARRGALVLLNLGLEPVPLLTVELRLPRVPVVRVSSRADVDLTPRSRRNAWSVSLSRLAPWSTAVLLLG